MTMNTEIHTLLGVAIEAFKSAETKGKDLMETMSGKVGAEREAALAAIEQKAEEAGEAGEQALHTLGAMVLSDIRRIADALEVIAKAAKAHLPKSLSGG